MYISTCIYIVCKYVLCGIVIVQKTVFSNKLCHMY